LFMQKLRKRLTLTSVLAERKALRMR